MILPKLLSGKAKKNCPAPRPEVRSLSGVVHGGLDRGELEQLGLNPEEILDFSTCVNPWGASPAVRRALEKVDLIQYPDPESRELCRAHADILHIVPECILAGNGTSELIGMIGQTFLRPGDRVLVVGPTYGEYARASILMGAEVSFWCASEKNGFAVDTLGVERMVKTMSPRVVFLCNPSNPTGTAIEPAIISGWARKNAKTLFVVDEAYLPFASDLGSPLESWRGRRIPNNILLLRSFTKDLGLAGLRLGFALGNREVIGWLARVRQPWNVNAMAQAAGLAALNDLEFRDRSLDKLRQDAEALRGGLRKLGHEPRPTRVHFFLVQVGDGAAIRLALLKRGILVRDCASFGLPAFVRIGPRRPEENQRLLSEIAEIE